MPQNFRLKDIGLVNRDKKLSFKLMAKLTMVMKETL